MFTILKLLEPRHLGSSASFMTQAGLVKSLATVIISTCRPSPPHRLGGGAESPNPLILPGWLFPKISPYFEATKGPASHLPTH